jgi:hypothetical protein
MVIWVYNVQSRRNLHLPSLHRGLYTADSRWISSRVWWGTLLNLIKNKPWLGSWANSRLFGRALFSAAERVTFWPLTNFTLCFNLDGIYNGRVGFENSRSWDLGVETLLALTLHRKWQCAPAGLTSSPGVTAHTENRRTMGAQLMPHFVKNT